MKFTEIMDRIRIYYKKGDALRYTGHLDLQKIWERYLRRSNLPLAYSQGFHPQPRINQALPLPLGITSLAEIIEIWLENNQKLDCIETKLKNTEQPGIEIYKLELIDPSLPKIQNMITGAEYSVTLLDPFDAEDLQHLIDQLTIKETAMREKRGRTYNLRPLLQELYLIQNEGHNPCSLNIFMSLLALPGATGRPDEVLSELEIDPNNTRITRTKLLLQNS